MRDIAMLISVIVMVTFPIGVARAQTVDEIIARHVEAIGGADAIRLIDNIVYTNGSYTEGDFSSDGNATMSRGRPYLKLVGDKEHPGSYMEGYDGAAWEWFADPGVVIRTVGAASEAGRHFAGVESPLFEYRRKRSVAELIGSIEFDDKPVFVVRLTRMDGFAEQYYLDEQSFMVLASSAAAPIHAFGEDVSTVTRMADYRRVGGVLMAHAFETVQVPSGDVLSTMRWGQIEVNLDLPGDWFSAPEFVRTPLQRFIEQLYEQRTDLNAVLWTYHHFRMEHVSTDTSDAVSMAGFQMLKMGEHDAAVGLLTQNVADYPSSADAHFGLGRALQATGRSGEAMTEFQFALSIDPTHRQAKDGIAAISE